MDDKWYAVYTKPRWEKKVSAALTGQMLTNYCPLNRVIKQWSDRRKTLLEPLFKSYVFVHLSEKQVSALRQVDGVLHLVHWLGKPAVIREEEIVTIRNFLALHTNVQVEQVVAPAGKLAGEPLNRCPEKYGLAGGKEAKTLRVTIPSLGCSLSAQVQMAPVNKAECTAAT